MQTDTRSTQDDSLPRALSRLLDEDELPTRQGSVATPAIELHKGINPLIASASTLFSQLIDLKKSGAKARTAGLRAVLTDGIKAFEGQALAHGVPEQQVITARYVLCTVADEAVVTTAWGTESEWSSFSLLSTFHQETIGGERFFQLAERFSRNPARYLHLLELMFVCLSLGFEGKYRVQARGMVELDDVRDSLFRHIRQVRGDLPQVWCPYRPESDAPRRVVRVISVWLLATCSLVCLAIMFGGFGHVLEQKREAVLERYQVVHPSLIGQSSES